MANCNYNILTELSVDLAKHVYSSSHDAKVTKIPFKSYPDVTASFTVVAVQTGNEILNDTMLH